MLNKGGWCRTCFNIGQRLLGTCVRRRLGSVSSAGSVQNAGVMAHQRVGYSSASPSTTVAARRQVDAHNQRTPPRKDRSARCEAAVLAIPLRSPDHRHPFPRLSCGRCPSSRRNRTPRNDRSCDRPKTLAPRIEIIQGADDEGLNWSQNSQLIEQPLRFAAKFVGFPGAVWSCTVQGMTRGFCKRGCAAKRMFLQSSF